jgi:hypothetical protein
MLTLPARRRLTLKCPTHPRAQYTVRGELPPPGCAACKAIHTVAMASEALDRVERAAVGYITRGSARLVGRAG